MITLLVILAYALPALSVYRRAGYVWNEKMLRGHEFSSICNICSPECKDCGDRKHYHRSPNSNFNYGCREFKEKSYIIPFHPTSLLIALPFAVAWPVTMAVFALFALSKMSGREVSFLKPPPVIETKEEKMERRLAEAQAEIADTNKRLKELGIDL